MGGVSPIRSKIRAVWTELLTAREPLSPKAFRVFVAFKTRSNIAKIAVVIHFCIWVAYAALRAGCPRLRRGTVYSRGRGVHGGTLPSYFVIVGAPLALLGCLPCCLGYNIVKAVGVPLCDPLL